MYEETEVQRGLLTRPKSWRDRGLYPGQSCARAVALSIGGSAALLPPFWLVPAQKGLVNCVSHWKTNTQNLRVLVRTSVCIIAWIGASLFLFLGLGFSTSKIGDRSSRCLFLCHCGFMGLGSEHHHRQGPWEEGVAYLIPGESWREHPGPGTTQWWLLT